MISAFCAGDAPFHDSHGRWLEDKLDDVEDQFARVLSNQLAGDMLVGSKHQAWLSLPGVQRAARSHRTIAVPAIVVQDRAALRHCVFISCIMSAV